MSSCASSTGATTASSTSASGGWSRSISRSSLTRMIVALPVWSWVAPVPRCRWLSILQPCRSLVEQVQADVAAADERVAERLFVARVHVRELDGDAGDHREAALRRVGDARERVD